TGIITTVTSGIKLLTSGVAGATVAQKLWNIAMSANPIGAVVTGVTALTAGVIALASAFNNAPEWEKECEEIRNHREELEKSNAEWETFIESQKKAEATTNSEMNHIQKLADELRTLADENGNVAESEQSRAKFILNELNEALGTEYSLNQGQITQYQQLSSEIDNLIAKRRAEALLKSKQEGYDKAVGELGAKQDTLNEEIRKYDLAVEAVERYKNQIEHTKQKMEELENTKPPDWEYEYDVLKSELDDLEDGLIGANKELKEQEGAMNTASVAVDQLSSTIEDYESTYQKILEGDYEAVFKSSYKSATGYADGTSAAIADGTADVDATAVESGINVAEAMANGIKLTVPNTAEAIAGLGPQLHDKVHSMIQGVRIEGESLILSLAGGVEKTIPDAVTISENGSQAIIDGLKIHDAVAQRLGVDYIQGVILGLESMRIPLQNTAASIMSGMHQFGAKPAVHSNSPSKDGIKLGSDYVVGVEIGLENEAPNLNDTAAETAKGMNDSFINACNSKIGSIREAIGGITGTIAEENQNKLKRYQKEVDKIKILHDFGIDDEKTYYAKLEYLRDHYLTKYSDAWIDATQEIYDYQSDCVKEAIDDELEELDRKLERGKISEEEYYKEIARIRDTYTEGSDEWYKLDDEIFEYNKRLFEEEKETVKNTYEEISDFINKKLDAIADKQKALSDKLVDNTHLFENVKINAGEDSYEFYRLNDFSDEIKNAKKYRELLTQAVDRIKSSGVSDSAISGILEHIDELGNDEEGLGYLEALLSANDKDFGEYMSSYAELLETEAGTAAMRYSDDMEKAAVEGYNYMKSEFEKIGLEVPESFYASGTLSAEKFGEAFVAELNLQMEEIRGRLLEFNVQLGTALGSGQTVVTHDNRTTTYHINAYDATDAVTQIKNHETIKRLSGA
ncbi:MAG: hypothetical protein J6B23_09030, partial [Clostridia bacterium]|nr:hypothetical protein [Clostridia bacterium]